MSTDPVGRPGLACNRHVDVHAQRPAENGHYHAVARGQGGLVRLAALALFVSILVSCSGGDGTVESACRTIAIGSLNDHIGGARTIDVWRLDRRLNPSRPLTSDHQSYDARLSPDGSKIVYATGRGHPSDPESGNSQWAVFVMNADGSRDERITNGPLDRWPDWSPDGTRIVFQRGARDGSRGIVIRNLATQAEQQLTRDSEVIYSHPVWAPRGNYLAVKAWDPATSTDQVAVLDADTGREIVRLGEATSLAWDPSGERLAVERSAFAAQQFERFVEVVDIPGGHATRVPESATKFATVVAWTQETGLVFVRNVRGPGLQLVSWPGSGTPSVFNPAPKTETYDGIDAMSLCPGDR